MKKILVIHNKYKLLGGEDIAVNTEISILKEKFDVKVLLFDNKKIDIFSDLYAFIFNKNPKSLRKLKKEVKNYDPDLIYVHNTWYKASVAIFDFLKKQNIQTIIKLHNFRYDCTRHYLMNNHVGDIKCCLKCGLTKKGFFNKYFQDSFIKSFLMIRYGKKYYKILQNPKFKIIVLTEFHKNYLIKIGLDENRIYTVHNPTDSSSQNKDLISDYIVYAGRISKEKGIDELISSYIKAELKSVNLKLIGEGPDLARLKSQYLSNNRIEFLGKLDNLHTKTIISGSKAVVTATKLFEGQPTLLCEASSLGIPSIFPKFGGIHEFFPDKTSLSFEQFNYQDLTLKIKRVETRDLIEEGVNNKEFLSKYFDNQKFIEKFCVVIND